MSSRELLSISALLFVASACASGGASTTQSSTGESGTAGASAAVASAPAQSNTSQRVRRSANLITAEELRESNHGNVYDLVAAARPEWLRASGPTSLRGGGGVAAYMDQQRIGGVAALRQIPINQARLIRFYPAAEAQSRFGLDNMGGAIQVETTGR